jgi:hypothetical protein
MYVYNYIYVYIHIVFFFQCKSPWGSYRGWGPCSSDATETKVLFVGKFVHPSSHSSEDPLKDPGTTCKAGWWLILPTRWLVKPQRNIANIHYWYPANMVAEKKQSFWGSQQGSLACCQPPCQQIVCHNILFGWPWLCDRTDPLRSCDHGWLCENVKCSVCKINMESDVTAL